MFFNKLLVKIRTFLQRLYLWNTTVSVYHVIEVFIEKIIRFDIDQRAGSVAYSFLLAIFPAIIFFFTLIPYFPIRHLDIQIMSFLENVMPPSLYETAAGTIHDIVSRPRGDVLSVGFILSIYASTSGMVALMRSFNMAMHSVESRSFLKTRLIALMLTLLLFFVLVIAVFVLVIGTLAIDFLMEDLQLAPNLTFLLIKWLTYLIIFTVFFINISILYYFAPAHHKRWSFFNVGATIASLLIIVATQGFSYYLSNFSSYNKLYGSIGTLIALMLWLYIIALLLIMGFEVNESLREVKSRVRNGELVD
jgi:membrane protein